MFNIVDGSFTSMEKMRENSFRKWHRALGPGAVVLLIAVLFWFKLGTGAGLYGRLQECLLASDFAMQLKEF